MNWRCVILEDSVCVEEKKIVVQFSSTNEMSAKNAMKLLLDTYSSESDEEYQEAQ